MEPYTAWQEQQSHQEWLVARDDMPDVVGLLEVVNPKDGTRWLNVNGSFVWRQPHPAHEAPYDHARREVWVGFTAYFVQSEEADAFTSWANSVDFWGRWMPDPPELSPVYFGEYGWSPAFEYMCSDVLDFEGWVKPEVHNQEECPATVQLASFRYLAESSGFDCSVEDSFSLCLPQSEFIKRLGLQWSGYGANYVDETGALAAFDPNVNEKGPTALLLRKDLLEKYLLEKGLALYWVVLGEKQVVGGSDRTKFQGRLKMSGGYRYAGNCPLGFVNFNPDIPEDCANNSLEVHDDAVSDGETREV